MFTIEVFHYLMLYLAIALKFHWTDRNLMSNQSQRSAFVTDLQFPSNHDKKKPNQNTKTIVGVFFVTFLPSAKETANPLFAVVSLCAALEELSPKPRTSREVQAALPGGHRSISCQGQVQVGMDGTLL